MFRFISIDPGSIRTGFALFDVVHQNPKLLSSGTIELDQKKPLPERLRTLAEDLESLFEKYSPVLMAIESIFFAKNAKSALHLGEARGVILMKAAEANLEIVEYSATEIKKTVTGMGRADKAQVQKMIRLLLKIPPNVELSSADQADAMAIGLAHVQLWAGKQRIHDRSSRGKTH